MLLTVACISTGQQNSTRLFGESWGDRDQGQDDYTRGIAERHVILHERLSSRELFIPCSAWLRAMLRFVDGHAGGIAHSIIQKIAAGGHK